MDGHGVDFVLVLALDVRVLDDIVQDLVQHLSARGVELRLEILQQAQALDLHDRVTVTGAP